MCHVVPNDWELYGLARLEGQGSGTLPPDQMEWMRQLGFDQLRGPGAWATYEQPSAPVPAAVPPAASPPPAE